MPVEPGASLPVGARRYCIVNGDDFGATLGINRGILEAHRRGILTSTSLMVDAPHARQAVASSREAPDLSLGLHAVFTTEEGEPLLDLEDADACRRELDRQFEAFQELTGVLPTHLDSHHHVHQLHPCLRDLFRRRALRHALPLRGQPLRGQSAVGYVGNFYGQEDWGETRLEWISVQGLTSLLESLPEGVTELGCHPGFVDAELDSIYGAERLVELKTLCDPAVRVRIRQLGIALISFAGLDEIS